MNKIDKPLARLIKKKRVRFKSITLEMKRRSYNEQHRNSKDKRS